MESSSVCFLLHSPSWFSCQASVFSSVLSHLNKNLKRRLEPSACHSSQRDCVIALRQINVTAQFYSETSRKIHRRGMRTCQPKNAKRREGSPGPLAPLFMCFFCTLLGLPYVHWASQECCLFYLRSSLRSSNLPLFYFHGLFPSLSFSHHHSGSLFPILST